VQDTGIGIPLEKQESIFQSFLQADNSTTRLFGGTGLGLSISRNLVKLMGGTLQLNSQVDAGSEFFFDTTFRVVEANNQSIPIMFHQKVLIVDDNQTARNLLKSIIMNFNWDVVIASSYEDALQRLAEKGANYFNLLLLDWSIGIHLASKLQHQLGESCPIIIMLTAYERGILLEDPLGSEFADSIITKPVTSSTLFDKVLETKVKRGELANNDQLCLNNERLIGLNLLIVDDSKINQEVAYQILTGEGANVTALENGYEAIELLITKPDYFHAMLMDVQMPIIDGYTATQKIRMIPELTQLPIIALTAGAFKSHCEAALAAGMNDFVAKPFEVEELIACIERQVYGHSAKKANTLPDMQPLSKIFDTTPLIDVAQGLKKWRDAEFYQQYLRLFLQQHGQDAEHIDHQLSNGHQTAAKEINHKLLGSAGALSLPRIAHLARDIEEMFSQQGNIDTLIPHFAPILSQTIDAINAYLAATTPQETEQAIIDNTATKEELEQLITALNSDDINLIEPTISALSRKLPKELFNTILTAIENFDFRQAEIIANELVADKSNKGE
jgi:CheY-like chemotaxis protein